MKSWLSIAATVAAVDAWMLYRGKDTLTAEYRSQAKDRPVVMAASTVYVLTHLWGVLPRKFDLFYGIGRVSKVPLKNRYK